MKTIEDIMLLDFYGNLLTEKQYNVMDMYLNDDMSLSEIGDALDITRQAVRDNISRTTKILLNYENKLGFVKRFQNINKIASDIKFELQNIDKNNFYNSVYRCLDLVDNIIDVEMQE